ncbi:hypothetical protein [Longitalea luteola]|uniref:hypothetical protein n=1 Tax=Longitalea luteola TaxID=2812563 RepID=UPI001A97D02C|nr:hypothetical protein [Longitalea luteola]
MVFFTICSNNYLAQALLLGNSLKTHYPEHQFLIFLVDVKDKKVDYDAMPFEVLPLNLLEPGLHTLVHKYNIIELNTCVKPRVIEYLFMERGFCKAVYFDPDIKVYGRLNEMEIALESNNIVLTPHIYTPIPLDGKQPGENNFLNYGIYNLGFIAVVKTDETLRFLNWWKERTYEQGYSRVDEGIFVDQLYINLVPIFFDKVYVLQHRGYNMAPWNLHERYLQQKGNKHIVNDKDELRFFHFSSFRLHSNELPLHYYNRFQLKDRPDLHSLYKEYDKELEEAGYQFFSKIPCAYVIEREEHILKIKKEEWSRKSWLKKIPLTIIKMLPKKLKNRLSVSLINN